ncbi:LOW QUALITY PROTEIN: spore germination protein [Bacillus sp. JCM 19046]|nr:LOW QUALITY PROTEIN: spore germination protein [Bacillus sp. JCM 19046]
MTGSLPNQLKVPPYMTLFLVHGMQIGVGILGFTRYIAEVAGYQAWMAVLLAGEANQLIIWMIFKTIHKADNGDLYQISKRLFGKWLGGILILLFSCYFAVLAIVVLRTYIEIVQVWIYPELTTWSIALIFLLVSYYALLKGFRVIAGLTFLFVVFPLLLWPTVIPVLEYAEWFHLTPVFNTTLREQLLAAFYLTLSFAGAELLLIYYPFLMKSKRNQLYAHLGSGATTLTYLMIALVTFLYYSPEQLERTIWPTLSAWKIVSFTFMERIEYICIALWLVVIFPNIVLSIWGASRLLKQQLKVSQRKTVVWILVAVFLATIQFETRESINLLNTSINYIGPFFIFGLIPFLWLCSFFLKSKGGSAHGKNNQKQSH